MSVNPFDVGPVGPQRAAVAGASGYRADTDDLLVDLELLEEDINPAVVMVGRSLRAVVRMSGSA